MSNKAYEMHHWSMGKVLNCTVQSCEPFLWTSMQPVRKGCLARLGMQDEHAFTMTSVACIAMCLLLLQGTATINLKSRNKTCQ